MEANQIILQGITQEQLLDGIRTVLSEFISKEQSPPEDTNDLLTRFQTCELLGITKSTLWKYTKRGKLKSYGIGRRTYYKKDEVLEAVKPLT